ncbi:MAG: hypothetical protein RO009_19395 [Pseudorhodoplanes sp.]|jgi:hypothetical protein|nr:hypothetical protein [Pseudorhodoplanes sp.]
MDLNLAKFLYEEDSLGVFILLSLIMGGGAAYLSGRAIAGTWRPLWQVSVYMLVLGAAVRFMHFALFEGTLLSPHYYLVDTAICLIFGWLGYRATRAGQMATQYGWLYNRSGWLEWRPKTRSNAANKSG